ncbi:MAG: histidine phosphatase family protein [Candidatus Edwardsbacteria bacterium]
MVTTLYLIRHGETEGADAPSYKGTIDVPLSENGMKQMKLVARYIVQHYSKLNNIELSNRIGPSKLSAVYCSDLSRAVRSAEIIAEPHGLIPVIITEIRERNFGIWEGMAFTEIKEKYPTEFESWTNNPLKYSPIGGESTLAIKERVMEGLDRILNNHHGENIAVVSHGGVNRIILCHFLGMPLENIFRIEQDYGALNIIELWDKYLVVKLINGIISSS